MAFRLIPDESRVTVEVHAAGLLSAAAHDLRLAAGGMSGESHDATTLVARFPVTGLRVVASRRHGLREWHDPSPTDAAEIEQRLRTEVFRAGGNIEVLGTVTAGAAPDRAILAVRAPGGHQRVETAVQLTREGGNTRVRGSCELSLRALGTGAVRVPFGAFKLEDSLRVEFDVALVEDSANIPSHA